MKMLSLTNNLKLLYSEYKKKRNAKRKKRKS